MKFGKHLLAFILAFILVFFTILVLKDKLFSVSQERTSKVSSKSEILQKSLDNGDIVVLGSSELDYFYQRFLPDNFFNNELKVPLVTSGEGGNNSIIHMAQLAGYYSKNMKKNAKVAIMFTMRDFTGFKTPMSIFLKYIKPNMLKNIFFNDSIPKSTKALVSKYLLENLTHINNPSLIHYYGVLYSLKVTDRKFFEVLKFYYASRGVKKNSVAAKDNGWGGLGYSNEQLKIMYQQDKLYDELKKQTPPQNVKVIYDEFVELIYTYAQEMKNVEPLNIIGINNIEELKASALKMDLRLSNNNEYGMTNYIYTRFSYMQKSSGTLQAISLPAPKPIEENIGYHNLVELIQMCKMLDIKPIFIMQNLNPLVYNNLNDYTQIMQAAKEAIERNGFEYLDLMNWDKEKYVVGELIDNSHPSEYTWVKIDNFIYKNFVKKENDE